MTMRGAMKARNVADPVTAERAPGDLDAMILIVENEGTPFTQLAVDEGLDLTLATTGSSWRCDWLEGVSAHA